MAVVIGLSAPAWRARAGGPTTAEVESLIRKGTELRRQGKDQQALPFFQQAYELARAGRTAAQLGLCEMQLGYFLPASEHLTESLAAKGDPWVSRHRDVLEQSRKQIDSHIADIVV